jgi:hypothetical protein
MTTLAERWGLVVPHLMTLRPTTPSNNACLRQPEPPPAHPGYEWLFGDNPCFCGPFQDWYKLSPEHQYKIHKITQAICLSTLEEFGDRTKIEELSAGLHPMTLALALLGTLKFAIDLIRPSISSPYEKKFGKGFQAVVAKIISMYQPPFLALSDDIIVLGVLAHVVPSVIEDLGFEQGGLFPGKSLPLFSNTSPYLSVGS